MKTLVIGRLYQFKFDGWLVYMVCMSKFPQMGEGKLHFHSSPIGALRRNLPFSYKMKE